MFNRRQSDDALAGTAVYADGLTALVSGNTALKSPPKAATSTSTTPTPTAQRRSSFDPKALSEPYESPSFNNNSSNNTNKKITTQFSSRAMRSDDGKGQKSGGGGAIGASATYNARFALPSLNDNDGDDIALHDDDDDDADKMFSRAKEMAKQVEQQSKKSSAPLPSFTKGPIHYDPRSNAAFRADSSDVDTPKRVERKDSVLSNSTASTAASVAFSEAELRYFRKIFERFDINKSGSLGFVEIKAMCRHLGVEIGDEELRDSIDEIDDNGNGLLEFDEFTQWLAGMGGGGVGSTDDGARGGGDSWAIVKSKIRAKGANPLTNKQIESFKEIFDHFDVNKSGTIDTEELRGVFYAMGRTDVSDDEIEEIMREVDDDGSGEIDFDEFLMLMCLGFSQGGGGMGEDGQQSVEDYIRYAFESCDPQRTDCISVEDLKELMLDMCDGEMGEHEVDMIIKAIPKDDHNRVCYTEWQSLWDACQCAS